MIEIIINSRKSGSNDDPYTSNTWTSGEGDFEDLQKISKQQLEILRPLAAPIQVSVTLKPERKRLIKMTRVTSIADFCSSIEAMVIAGLRKAGTIKEDEPTTVERVEDVVATTIQTAAQVVGSASRIRTQVKEALEIVKGVSGGANGGGELANLMNELLSDPSKLKEALNELMNNS